MVFFGNDLHSTSYTVTAVAVADGRTTLHFGDTLFIVGMCQATEFDAAAGTVTTDTLLTGYGRVDNGKHAGRWLYNEDRSAGLRIEAFTDKAEVQELCRMLGTGQLNQRAAQVAAWHLNNDMSWQELAGKQLRFANGTARPYFSAREIQAGMQIVAVATERARQRETKIPGKQDSLSRK